MSGRVDRLIGWVLIILSGSIFVGIVMIGVPRLMTSNVGVQAEADASSVNSIVVAIATPLPTDPPPPTATSTALPTETPLPIATAVVEIEPTATPLPTEVPPSPTPAPQTGSVVALEDIILFASPNPGAQTGAIFNAGDSADALGKSADGLWIHVVTISDQGWALAVQVMFEAGEIALLPESDFVYVAPVVIEADTPTAQAVAVVVESEQSDSAELIQPTQQPTFPPPPPTPVPAQQATIWPTHTPVPAFPTPIPTAVSNAAPAAAPTNPPSQNAEPVGNAIAWWDIDPGSARATGNGTWQVDVVVRVPTSFQYTFDMAYLWRVNLRDRNLGGDDYYVLSLSGMPCGTAVADPLVARQTGVRMKVVNEFSVEEGPIFVSPGC